MCIKIIYDNRKENELMKEGWGFSCLIHIDDRKILFDTGANQDDFIANLQKLNIRCEEITDIVFSHNHADHTAGFPKILKRFKKGVPLYIPKGFPTNHIPRSTLSVVVSDFAQIGRYAHTIVLKGGETLFEQALILQTKEGLVIITGCAHPGIIRLIEVAKEKFKNPVHLVLGGFHLFRESSMTVSETVAKFQSLKVEKAAPCHCTGDHAIAQFEKAYTDRFCKIGTGSILPLAYG